jgi:hypothetical protein
MEAKCIIDGRSRLLFFLLRRSQTPRKHTGRLESYPYTLSLFQPSMQVPYFHMLSLKFCKVGTNTLWDRKRAWQFPFMYILEAQRE